MPTPSELLSTYQHMTDGQLLEIANEGGFRPEAELALAEELHRRKLKLSDLPLYKETLDDRLQAETKQKSFRGTGLRFYGRKFLNEADKQANIQIKTKWFAFSYIPLIPLASYRFQCSGSPDKWFQWSRQRRPLGRVPLNWNQAVMTWLKAIACIVGTIAFIALRIWHQNRTQ